MQQLLSNSFIRTTQAKERRGLPLGNARALLEAGGIFAAGLALPQALGGNGLTVVTGLLAAQYGFWPGAVAGACAAIAADPLHWHDALLHGLGLLALGTLVGLVGDRHRRACAQRRTREAELAHELETWKAHCGALVKEKETAERHLAHELHPLLALHKAFERIEAEEPQARAFAVLLALGEQCGASQIALYRQAGDCLALWVALGERDGRPVTLTAAQQLPLSHAFRLEDGLARLVLEDLPFERGSHATLAMLHASAAYLTSRSHHGAITPARPHATALPAAGDP